MEENKIVIKKNGRSASKADTCCLHGGGCCTGHNFSFLRVFLGIVLLLFVFCGGFKLGVLVGFIGSGGMSFGSHSMMNHGYPRPGMMRWEKDLSVYDLGEMRSLPPAATATPKVSAPTR